MYRPSVLLLIATAILFGQARPAPAQSSEDDRKWEALKESMRRQGILDSFGGGNSDEPAELLEQIEKLKRQGKLREAATLSGKLVSRVKQVYGATAPATAVQVNALAMLLEMTGEYARAEEQYKSALTIFEKHPARFRDVATVRNNLGNLYMAMGRHKEAEAEMKRGLTVRETKLAKTDLAVAQSLDSLGELCRQQGRFEKSETHLTRSYEIRLRAGKESLAVAGSLNKLGLLYEDTGRFDLAEKAYRDGLEMRRRLKANPADVAISVSNLAGLHRALGRFREARQLLAENHAALVKEVGDRKELVATSLNNLASVHEDLGSYDEAGRLYEQSLKIRIDLFGKDHPAVAVSHNNLGLLQRVLGQFDKAEQSFEKARAIAEDRLGPMHPLTATILTNLANLYSVTKRHKAAEKLYLQAMKINEQRLGDDHPGYAISRTNLGNLYRNTERAREAKDHLEAGLKIRKAAFGKDHPAVADSLNELAGLAKSQGEYDTAEKLYRESLEIREAKLGKDHLLVSVSLANLASLMIRKGDPEKAALSLDRARRNVRRHLSLVLPMLSEREKEAFFRNTYARQDLEMALSMGLVYRTRTEVTARSAEWLINGKAPVQESLATSILLTRRSNDPKLAKLTGQLLGVRQQLARLTLIVPRGEQDKLRRERIEELTKREQELAKEIRQASGRVTPPLWVSAADLREHLPADAVLIDFARFRVADFAVKPGQKAVNKTHYAAWVTPPKGDVKAIDLGEAEKIDQAVKGFRQAIAKDSKGIEDEEKAEKAIRVHLDALSKLILTPLLPHIGTSKRWLISPDGNLWLVPFEALTLESKTLTYAIEKYRISYLTSGRDLIPVPESKVEVTAPVIFADPDYNLDPKRARQVEQNLGLKGEAFDLRSGAGASRLGKAKALKGTASEAKDATPLLKLYTRLAPKVRTQEEALEGVFKSLRNPRAVLLATHGFFLPDPDSKDEPKTLWENPLLRCGLLLAGCNRESKEGDDGVLTALEVIGVDLDGCELVVLSACETGVGEVQVGEGVAGLRQAFQLAGAKTVVSTLWQVPDKSSARLMKSYFENLSKGKLSKADALRAAKLKSIEERRSDFAAAHPFFWAAFTSTGD